MNEISIGSEYLANSAFYKEDESFSIAINDQVFSTTKHHALCLSNKIKGLYVEDPTINKYTINVKCVEKDTCIIIENLINYGIYKGKINLNTSLELYKIGIEMQNNDLMSQYASYFENTEITIDNLEDFVEFSLETKNYTICKNFITSHFLEIPHNKLVELFINFGYDFAEQVFTDSELNVNSEDDILLMSIALCTKSNEFKRLFEHIQLEFCSNEAVKQFIEFYENVIACSECMPFISCIKRRLISSGQIDRKNRRMNASLNNQAIVAINKYPKTTEFFKLIYELIKSNIDDKEFLHYAIESGYTKTNSDAGLNVLLKASQSNDFELCKALFESGEPADTFDANLNTVLHWFAYNGNAEAVSYFVDKVDINSQNISLNTALHDACQYGKINVVRVLLQNHPNLTLLNSQNRVAAEVARNEEIKLLIINASRGMRI